MKKEMEPTRAQESFSLYAVRVALGRLGLVGAAVGALPKVDPRYPWASFHRPMRERALRAVSRGLNQGPGPACAAMRAAQYGSVKALGFNPYSAGALGAAEAVTASLLCDEDAALRFAGATRAARSGSELAVMGMGLRGAWVLAGSAQGEFVQENRRLSDATAEDAIREMPADDRETLLRSLVVLLPLWAEAVERVGKGKADPVAVFCYDLHALDGCQSKDELLGSLFKALEGCPHSVLISLGEKAERHESRPVGGPFLAQARVLARIAGERSILSSVATEPEARRRRSSSL